MKKVGNLLLTVFVVLFAGRLASATTVSYGTFGTFANPGAGFTIANTAVVDGTSSIATGGSNLTFTGVSDVVDAPTINSLGVFTTTTPLTTGEIDSYSGTSFALTIDQFIPGMHTGMIAGIISGTLRKSTLGGASTLTLDFGGKSLTLGTVTYRPDNLDIAGATIPTASTLQGKITAVPVHPAAWGGLLLFGLVGSVRFLRRGMAA